MKPIRALAVLCAASLTAPPLAGQSAGLPSLVRAPAWLENWSPLQARADLPRRLPFVAAVPASLLLPQPRLGLFWTAGNPAALREELADARTDFAVALDRQSGTLRRPLDPGRSGLRQVSGVGWSPVDDRVALLGRVVLDQERFDPGGRADAVEAYPTSPFITLDTSTTATRRTRALLEGALSLRLGDWGLGAALGYETRAHETIEAGFVRRTRQTMPGVTVGLTHRLGPLRLGPYVRWRNRAETIDLIERQGNGIAIQLEGLREVKPINIIGYYYRRIEENTPSAGWSMAGPLAGGHWTVSAERSWLRQWLTRQEVNDPTRDTWDADAWSGGGAYQRPFTRRGLFTLDLRYTTLRGKGDLGGDTLGVMFRAAERALVGSAEVRVLPDTVGWALVVGLQVRWEQRRRDALTVPVMARVTSLTNGVSVELGRAFSPRLLATTTLGYGYYSANTSFPAEGAIGPTYRTYVMPEYDLASRPAQLWLGAVGVRWTVRPRAVLWITGTGETVFPLKQGPTSLGPDGSRSTMSVTGGVTLYGR